VAFDETRERRADKRWKMELSATLLTRGTGKRREAEEAQLEDIGPRGARLRTSKQVRPGTEVVLDVHCRLPSGDLTTLRFEGTVLRVVETAPFEIAIKFRGRGRFLRDALNDWLNKAELKDRSESIS
jgi:PilZ domain-containing protein